MSVWRGSTGIESSRTGLGSSPQRDGPAQVAGWIEPVVLLAAGVLVAIFALRTPLGLPYDEPAHWHNVLFYAQHLRMPVMGQDPVWYEAQQTPLFYSLAAFVVRVVGEENGWLAVRLLNGAGHVAMVALVWRILRATIPSAAWVTIAGTLVVAINPMLLVMSGSIQNDTLALVFVFGAIMVGARYRTDSWWCAIWIGVLGGLAVLTKLSTAPAVVGLVIWLLLRRSLLKASVAALIVGFLNGWWIVRNLMLYGDLTGQAGVELTGAQFGNVDVGPIYLARTVATYLILPTEYLRNTIEAPPPVDLAVVAVFAVMLIGGVWLAARRWSLLNARAFTVVALVAALSIGSWLGEVLLAWPVAFRTAYAAFPLFALGAGGSVLMLRRRARPFAVVVLVLVLLGIVGWVLFAMAQVAGPGLPVSS